MAAMPVPTLEMPAVKAEVSPLAFLNPLFSGAVFAVIDNENPPMLASHHPTSKNARIVASISSSDCRLRLL